LRRACRQQVFPEAVVPIAIKALRKDPLAGEMYDGELIVALGEISREYWKNHESQAREVKAIAKALIPQDDEKLQRDLVWIVDKVSVSNSPE
jgi:CDI immunity proteins